MTETYQLCTQDTRQVLHYQLATPQFHDKINLSPYRQFDPAGRRGVSGAGAPGGISTATVAYPLAEANRALTDLRNGALQGAAVLVP